jgi:hypothetical protein
MYRKGMRSHEAVFEGYVGRLDGFGSVYRLGGVDHLRHLRQPFIMSDPDDGNVTLPQPGQPTMNLVTPEVRGFIEGIVWLWRTRRPNDG